MTNTHDLDLLRRFATSSRSRPNFGSAFLKLNPDDGTWTANKKRANGRRLAADTPDTMAGFQQFKNKKPILCVVRVADGIPIPDRSELDETDERGWANKRDPWEPVSILPFWDPESHELFMFSTTSLGGRDAVAYLLEAYADTAAAHPQDAGKLPLVELGSESYINTHGKKIHKPIFDIVDWIERPAAIRRIKPPPIEILAIEDKTVTVEGAEIPHPVPAKSPTKPKRKITVPDAAEDPDMDDEIPF